jgi:hypothetical protein
VQGSSIQLGIVNYVGDIGNIGNTDKENRVYRGHSVTQRIHPSRTWQKDRQEGRRDGVSEEVKNTENIRVMEDEKEGRRWESFGLLKSCPQVNKKEKYKVVQSCVELCGAVQSCAELCRAVQSCAELCRAVQSCAELCRAVQSCAELCRAL